MQSDELRLDGNSAAGALRELFARDMTAAVATCAGCRSARPLGALLEYGRQMGVVLRCPGCDTPMLRMVRGPTWLRVDLSGTLLITVPDA
jgi:hypothetical protein